MWSPVSAAFGHNVSKTISSGEKLGHIQAFTSSNADINKIAVCAQSFVIITKNWACPFLSHVLRTSPKPFVDAELGSHHINDEYV